MLKTRTKIPSRSSAVVDVDINATSTDKVLMIPDEYCLEANLNMSMYSLHADLSKRKKHDVTAFAIINLSDEQYLEFPKNHDVMFAEKDDTEEEVYEIEIVDMSPRMWVPSRQKQPVAEIANISPDSKLHKILASASNFINHLPKLKSTERWT